MHIVNDSNVSCIHVSGHKIPKNQWRRAVFITHYAIITKISITHVQVIIFFF